MRLLVGLDKRDGGKDALELTRVLGNDGGSAVVVSVIGTGPLPMEYAVLSEEEAEECQPLFAEAREKLAGFEVEARAFSGGSAAGILTTQAEQEHFDAIVVGSPHRGAFGRVMIGSVATSLLNGAPTDVAVAPKGYAEAPHEPIREIAVGYDGTPEAKLALRRAEALATRDGARIKLLTVVSPPAPVPTMVASGYTPQLPPEPDRVINEGIHSVDPKLAAEAVRRDGDPADQLIKSCEEGVDLLVLGSRGYGPLSRALLGSVSRQLVRNAACPVMVVSRP